MNDLNKQTTGYRPGEREQIAAYLAKHKPTICPGFGCGIPVGSAPGPQARKNAEFAAKARKRLNISQETTMRRRSINVLVEYKLDSAPGAAARIAKKLGLNDSTVRNYIKRLKVAGKL